MKTTKKLIESFSKTETMASYDFWRVLNEIRADRGASHIEHGNFLDRVIDECNFSKSESFRVKNARGNAEVEAYTMNRDHMILVGMRESKIIRRQVLKWLRDLSSMIDDLKQHKIDRCSAALNYKTQSDMVKQVRDSEGKETRFYHFSNEADLLNSFVLGMPAAKYRKVNGLDKTDNLRDTLSTIQLECIAKLEMYNTSFIAGGIDFETRKSMLDKIFMRDFNERLINEHILIDA